MRKYLEVFYALLIGVLATMGVAVWKGLCSFYLPGHLILC